MKLRQIAIILMFIFGRATAQNVQVTGTLSHRLVLPTVESHQTGHEKMLRSDEGREIKLLKVKLSDKARQSLVRNARRLNASTLSAPPPNQYPAQVQLTMNGVPVFDQGNHGTCVTFAVTAAIDAAFKRGAYISQLCQLQLGNYLAQNGYRYSGWDGTDGLSVLAQMDAYGFINKKQQALYRCGGLLDYPITGHEPDSSMSLETFHQISEPLAQDNVQVVWSTLLDMYSALIDNAETHETLMAVKKSIAEGDRVTFGTLLLDLDLGTMGAVGRKKSAYDTWLLTPEIAQDISMETAFAGHEMVITGYDDQAIAVDEQGRKYRGLLTLRNSWGEAPGDQGNFYMSYDYFKLFVIEAYRIRALK